MMGTFHNVIGYDIVSAYPFQASKLPCLEHGQWQYTTNEKEIYKARHACVHYRITDIGEVPWGPLPCRLRNGTIVFPRSGSSGWVWRDEYRVTSSAWRGVEFLEAWMLQNDCGCRPFQAVVGWFEERIRLGKTQKGRTLKLALNSIYGKLAQSTGSRQFASRVWAGMITSGTRAQLLELLVRHRDWSHVIALATDGLYSTEVIQPNGDPPIPGSTLGTWEVKYHGTMTFVRPGIYWSHDDDTLRARGMGRRTLAAQRQSVLDAIADNGRCADSECTMKGPHAHCGESDLFGGARACVYRLQDGRLKRSRFYGEWHKVPARVSLDPAPKRRADWSLHQLDGIESAPYRGGLSDEGKLLRVLSDLYWGMR